MEYALFLLGGDFMYKKIDDFYKKNSPYKKIKIWTYILAFLVTILLKI